MLNGCDISRWQGSTFDVSQHDFVIAKATEGVTLTDNCFHTNMRKAIELGKCIGAYHYARPENNSAKKEAEHFVNTVKPYIGNCLFALDWEGTALSYPIEWALEWLQEVERITGVKPLIYCSESFVKNCKPIADNGNGVWVAKWSDNTPNYEPFSVMAIWQYTNTPYDKDKFFGDSTAWERYCAKASAEDNKKCDCEMCNELEEWLMQRFNKVE